MPLPPSRTRIIGLLMLLSVCLLLASEIVRQPWLMYVFKPLASLLILLVPALQWKRQASPFVMWITVGLFFSLVGDIVLMFPGGFFVYGLLAFLLAHVAYLIAFSRQTKFPARFSLWLLYLALLAVFFLVFLFPALPRTLLLPVIVYIFFVASMSSQAMGRFLTLRNRPAALAALGTLFFMLSDSLLAFDRFHSPIPAAVFLVLIPYYLGQWLIALSTVSTSPQHSPPLPS